MERETGRIPEDGTGPSPESRTDPDLVQENGIDPGPGPGDETGPEKERDPGPGVAGPEKETGITTTEDIILGNQQKQLLHLNSLLAVCSSLLVW